MKKKTKVAVWSIIFLCLSVMAFIPVKLSVYAKSTAGQEPTEYLEQTLQEFGYVPEGNYKIDFLYSDKLSQNGYEYTFTLKNQPCYALMIRELAEDGNVYYDITELFVDSVSPFSLTEGKKVYIDMFTYIGYYDNTYMDLQTHTVLTEKQVEKIAERGFHYGGYEDFTTEYEVISYDNKSSSSYQFSYGLPNYYSSSYANACANVAGGIVLGYYDIFFSELIPNYNTGYNRNGSWRYYIQSSEVTAVINELHFAMNTNLNNGTAFSDFKNGFQNYANGKGRNVNYLSIKTNGVFDYNSYKSHITQSKPVVLFLSSFNVAKKILPIDNSDTIEIQYYTVNHVMVGCGYQEIDYYRNGSLFRSDQYLKVSTALSTIKSGYMRLNDNTQINEAISVNIY